MPRRRTSLRPAAAWANRMVASRGNGATKTTLRMAIACTKSARTMKVVFLACSYPPEMQQYTRGLAEVGADVYGVGDQPAAALPASLKAHLSDYLQVPRLLDEDDVVAKVSAWLKCRQVDR